MDLTDDHWTVLEPLIGERPKRADGRGRPWRRRREGLNGILWMLRSGAQWADRPERYPPSQTGHRRFQRGVRDGPLARVFAALAQDLHAHGTLALSACFRDGTWVGAQTGAAAWERPSGAQARNAGHWRLWQTGLVFLSPSVPPRRRRTR